MPIRAIPALALLLLLAMPAGARDDLERLVSGAVDVSDAVALMSAALQERGFTIDLVIDHAANAASVGLDLRPTQVIFASPRRLLQRLLLAQGATVGIDLPLKFLVYEDNAGEPRLLFNEAGYLFDRHDLEVRDPVYALLDRLVGQFGALENGLVSVPSTQGFDATVASLQLAIAANPELRVPLVVDFDQRVGGGGKHRLPTLILFGNPNLGTPLIQADQRIGIDLPQRLLVWEDPDGQVSIVYNDPFFIADRHAVTGEQERLGLMARVLDDLARAGSAAGLTGVAARSAVAVTTVGADSSAAGQVDLALP